MMSKDDVRSCIGVGAFLLGLVAITGTLYQFGYGRGWRASRQFSRQVAVDVGAAEWTVNSENPPQVHLQWKCYKDGKNSVYDPDGD